MTKTLIAVLAGVVLSGCTYRPIVDPARLVGHAAVPGGARSKRGVIRNCLTGRGHAVLN